MTDSIRCITGKMIENIVISQGKHDRSYMSYQRKTCQQKAKLRQKTVRNAGEYVRKIKEAAGSSER